jgi:CTP synthase
VPLALRDERLDDIVCKHFGLDTAGPDLADWMAMVNTATTMEETVNISLVGKYVDLRDSYISVAEALAHGGIGNKVKVNIDWIDSEEITADNVAERLQNADGVLVPGGFGQRGVEGKIETIRYCREHNVPFFGICLGMQLAVIEYSRNVLGLTDANSAELDPQSTNHVIDIMPEQKEVRQLGGTMRLGRYPCKIQPGTLAEKIYGESLVYERHRHRFEVNNDYRDALEQAGAVFSGRSPDNHIVEMMELPNHPWYLAVQFHPEFKSRPNRPHPVFQSFIKASMESKRNKA